MAHNNWKQLQLLLNSLDHPQNEIFLHIDKKAISPTDDIIRKYVTHSPIQIYHDLSVAWGGDTQIKCELLLLTHAVKSHHDYYHLLTGMDIPLVRQSEIHSFFTDNAGKNFISFSNKGRYEDRVRYYYLLQNHIGRLSDSSPLHQKALAKVQGILLKTQMMLGVNRTNHLPYTFYKGSAYFSITHNFAAYLVDNFSNIMKYMGYSIGGDEVFVQTVIMNSPYADTVVNDNLRYIDWSDSDQPGAPKTFTMKDYDTIVNSGKFFARKFDQNKDLGVIHRLYSNLD